MLDRDWMGMASVLRWGTGLSLCSPSTDEDEGQGSLPDLWKAIATETRPCLTEHFSCRLVRTEDLKVQKAWNGISTEKQGSSVGCWVSLCRLPPEGNFISPSFQLWGWKHDWRSQRLAVGFEQSGLTVGLVSVMHWTGKNWERGDQLRQGGKDPWSHHQMHTYLEPRQLFL